MADVCRRCCHGSQIDFPIRGRCDLMALCYHRIGEGDRGPGGYRRELHAPYASYRQSIMATEIEPAEEPRV